MSWMRRPSASSSSTARSRGVSRPTGRVPPRPRPVAPPRGQQGLMLLRGHRRQAGVDAAHAVEEHVERTAFQTTADAPSCRQAPHSARSGEAVTTRTATPARASGSTSSWPLPCGPRSRSTNATRAPTRRAVATHADATPRAGSANRSTAYPLARRDRARASANSVWSSTTSTRVSSARRFTWVASSAGNVTTMRVPRRGEPSMTSRPPMPTTSRYAALSPMP